MDLKIGSTVRRLRAHRDLTLKDLAEATGMSLSYLSLIERDKRDPSLSNLTKIAHAFDLPPSILIFLSTELDQHESVHSDISSQLLSIIKECFQNDDRFPSLP